MNKFGILCALIFVMLGNVYANEANCDKLPEDSMTAILDAMEWHNEEIERLNEKLNVISTEGDTSEAIETSEPNIVSASPAPKVNDWTGGSTGGQG